MFKALYQSFYSKPLYIDVAQNWRGLGFSFLFALVALYCIPLSLSAFNSYKAFLRDEAPFYFRQIPAITIDQGKLTIDRSLPYVIVDHTNRPFVIFDSANEEQRLKNLYIGQTLVTEHYAHIRKDSGEIRTIPFENMSGIYFTQTTASEWAVSIKKWFLPIFYLSSVIFLFILRILQVLFYGMIGMGLNKILRSFLDYSQVVRIAVIAITPVLVIDVILMITGMTIPNWGWVGFFIAMVYMIFGLRANRGLLE